MPYRTHMERRSLQCRALECKEAASNRCSGTSKLEPVILSEIRESIVCMAAVGSGCSIPESAVMGLSSVALPDSCFPLLLFNTLLCFACKFVALKEHMITLITITRKKGEKGKICTIDALKGSSVMLKSDSAFPTHLHRQ